MVFVKTTRTLSKLEDRSKSMLFMGYEAGSKAYISLDPATLKFTLADMCYLMRKSPSNSLNKVNQENFHWVLKKCFKSQD